MTRMTGDLAFTASFPLSPSAISARVPLAERVSVVGPVTVRYRKSAGAITARENKRNAAILKHVGNWIHGFAGYVDVENRAVDRCNSDKVTGLH